MKLLEDLIEQDLSSFKILQMSEVYRVNSDGFDIKKPLGVFKHHTTATAFAGQQTDSNYIKVRDVLILTDGQVGFSITGTKVEFFDDEQEVLKIKENALKKLSPDELKILNLA